jgi:hypothetical protein
MALGPVEQDDVIGVRLFGLELVAGDGIDGGEMFLEQGCKFAGTVADVQDMQGENGVCGAQGQRGDDGYR